MKLSALWLATTHDPSSIYSTMTEGSFESDFLKFTSQKDFDMPVEIARDMLADRSDIDHNDIGVLLRYSISELKSINDWLLLQFERLDKKLAHTLGQGPQDYHRLRNKIRPVMDQFEHAMDSLRSTAVALNYAVETFNHLEISDFVKEVISICNESLGELERMPRRVPPLDRAIRRAQEILVKTADILGSIVGHLPSHAGVGGADLRPAIITTMRGNVIEADHVVKGSGNYYYVCFGYRPAKKREPTSNKNR